MAKQQAVNKITGGTIQDCTDVTFTDGSDTPVTSPISAGTSKITLKFPPTASRLIFKALTANVGLQLAGASTPSWTVYAMQAQPVVRPEGTTIEIVRDSSTVVEFFFELCNYGLHKV